MARPRKEGLEYFPHDTDASDDEKIEVLRANFGNDGYAFYFIICERIYKRSEPEFDLSNEALTNSLIKKIGVNSKKFYKILEIAVNVGCFDYEEYVKNNKLTSNGIKKRFAYANSMREKWRNKKNTNEFSQGKMGEKTGESIAKHSIANIKDIDIDNINNRANDYLEFAGNVFLSPEEHQSLCNKFGTNGVMNLVSYIGTLSRKKSEGFVPAKDDFTELLQMINSDTGYG